MFLVVHGPADRFATAMPLAAGNHAVFMVMLDERFEGVPGHRPEVRMLTVVDGAVGAAPTPTLRFEPDRRRLPDRDHDGTERAATIHVDNTVGGPFQRRAHRAPARRAAAELRAWGLAAREAGLADWSTSPATTYRLFFAGAEQQTVTIVLAGGDLRVEAPTSFEEGGAFSSAWVNVG